MKKENKTYRSDEVFVAGSFPEHTFYGRDDTDLSEILTDYLESGRGNCLVVHGSSKSGKTVLVEKWLPDEFAIWVKGDEIASIDDFYRRIIDELGLFREISVSTSNSVTVGATAKAGTGRLASEIFKYEVDEKIEQGVHSSESRSNEALSVSVVKRALKAKPVPIVIDDFHFIDADLRIQLARVIKDLIRHIKVILIAIPQVAFEPVRTLPDMDWRVIDMQVPYWDVDELEQIAVTGFDLLNILDHEGAVGARLARESHGAPIIMQRLCLDYVLKILGLKETSEIQIGAVEPDSWEEFLAAVASARPNQIFGKLAEGRDPRGQKRLTLVTRDKRRTDIYGAILLALSKMEVSIEYDAKSIESKLSVLFENSPPGSSVSQTLTRMADIAEENRGDSDPAISYVKPKLQIVDPFFSFYLRNAAWELPPPRGLIEE